MIISLENLIPKHNMKIHGAIHVGGHRGQEASNYNDANIKNAIFFEPCKNNYDICKSNVEKFGYGCYNLALGSHEGSMTMYTETVNAGMSSSLLKPKLHLIEHSSIVFDGTEEVQLKTLDGLLESEGLGVQNFNLINMDVQGYELEVLKGSRKTLSHVDYIYTEINRAELYENCAMIDELDSFLAEYGFTRKETEWFNHGNWGDALYIKEQL